MNQDLPSQPVWITIDHEATRRKFMSFVIDSTKTVIFSSFMVSDALQFLLDREITSANLHAQGQIWQIKYLEQEKKGE